MIGVHDYEKQLKMLKTPSSIVSSEWLKENLFHSNLIVIDATMTKITGCDDSSINEGIIIRNSRFLDIKNTFSETSAPFPNTLLSPDIFEEKAQDLGINNDSCIVVYDIYGYYSCVRVWWMFKAMGIYNIAVLDGGLPNWTTLGYPVQKEHSKNHIKGNIKVKYTSGMIHNHEKVLNSIDDKEIVVLDARSYNRFLGTNPEPREGLRSGHIPNSKSLPYSSILSETKMKSTEELVELFSEFKDKNLVFSCGSGITACILALGAEIAGIKNKSVYDGSWTEWGSLNDLPIGN